MKRREDRQRESGSAASRYHVVTSNYVTLDTDLYLPDLYRSETRFPDLYNENSLSSRLIMEGDHRTQKR